MATVFIVTSGELFGLQHRCLFHHQGARIGAIVRKSS